MQRKAHGIHPAEEHRLFPGGAVKLRQFRKLVGKQHLFPQSEQEPPQTQAYILPAVGPMLQFPGHIGIADDGACDQLGKQRHIRAEGDEVFLGPGLSPVHIHGIAHALEGIEADADGQRQTQQRDACSHRRVEGADEEIRVLEYRQQPHPGGNGQEQKAPSPPFAFRPAHGQAAEVEEQNGADHQQHILGLPPGVEQQARQQQHAVLPGSGGQKIGHQHRRQKPI